MNKFGYIQIEFGLDFKESLRKWCDKYIDPSDYIFGEINGENIGGIVVDDAHITACYGIPLDIQCKEQIINEVENTFLPIIKISSIGCFHLKEHRAKIIYLLIDDDSGMLEIMNNQFKKYVSSKLQTIKPFIPHISIGYVSENFDEKKLTYDGLNEVQPTKIKYYS